METQTENKIEIGFEALKDMTIGEVLGVEIDIRGFN